MKNSVTLRIVLALAFVPTILAFSGSGSARMAHLRSGEGYIGKLTFCVRDADRKLPDGENFPIQDATIELAGERGGCNPDLVFTSITGYAHSMCPYGKVDIKISRLGYEDYTEDGYEFSQDETKEVTLKKSE